MEHFKLKLDRTSIEHHRPSINVRSLLTSANCVTNETISQRANSESFRAKNERHTNMFPNTDSSYFVANCLYVHLKLRKVRHFYGEGCQFVCFETRLGKPMLTLNDSIGLKNTTRVYLIHLELRRQLPCQISTGKCKYINPCLDFLGIPDQRTAYVKRRPGWTYIRRTSVTPDLIKMSWNRLMFIMGIWYWQDDIFVLKRSPWSRFVIKTAFSGVEIRNINIKKNNWI